MSEAELRDLLDVFLAIVRQTDERMGAQPDPRVEQGIREVFNLAMQGLAYRDIVEALKMSTRSLKVSQLPGVEYRYAENVKLLEKVGARL